MSASSAVADEETVVTGNEAMVAAGRGSQRREDEFTQFATTALVALKRTAWHLTGDEHQACELVQQTL
ncbi:MAG: hypothetical protein FWE61_03770, partial [Micrococcales bacterium]|nr:hypothetical protein [Micrococcales bacterium]